jgi:CrcB protein
MRYSERHDFTRDGSNPARFTWRSLTIDCRWRISYRHDLEAATIGEVDSTVAYLWVALGGALGAATRYGVAQWAGSRWGWGFPWGTLVVNVTGSLAIGLLMALLIARGTDPAWRLLLVTGFLGGYTTFSSYSFETLTLLEARRWDAAALYAAGSVLVGLLACAVGLGLGRVLSR